jgi:hypothetical protein
MKKITSTNDRNFEDPEPNNDGDYFTDCNEDNDIHPNELSGD